MPVGECVSQTILSFLVVAHSHCFMHARMKVNRKMRLSAFLSDLLSFGHAQALIDKAETLLHYQFIDQTQTDKARGRTQDRVTNSIILPKSRLAYRSAVLAYWRFA
jgi:hypothetical protein